MMANLWQRQLFIFFLSLCLSFTHTETHTRTYTLSLLCSIDHLCLLTFGQSITSSQYDVESSISDCDHFTMTMTWFLQISCIHQASVLSMVIRIQYLLCITHMIHDIERKGANEKKSNFSQMTAVKTCMEQRFQSSDASQTIFELFMIMSLEARKG